VLDLKRAPLASAAVQISGTHVRALTGADGRYRLVVPASLASADSVEIVARQIGFAPISRRVVLRGSSTTANFILQPEPIRLTGVVVTGAGAVATDEGAPALAKERARDMIVASPAPPLESRAAASARGDRFAARSDDARVGRGKAAKREADPAPGVLTAAVWDDSQHWQQYTRFLGRARENAWNPWGLEVPESNVRPARGEGPSRSARRALDVGFLVDATGSMGDEMAFLQSELKDIVRRVRAVEPDLDVRLSVVFYRDRGDEFITKSLPFTRNADDAVAFIAGTSAGGGGDYPEDMNAGLEAMMRQRWSRDDVPQMLFLLADAPPHQYPGQDYTYHEAIQDAAAHGIAIYPVAASGVDKPTEFLFRAMAVMTGGKYVFLTDDSGVGNSHEVPDIRGYTVEKLNDLMVREIRSYVVEHTLPPRMANR
jgi:Mg-chelatase subunit ChlD